MSIYFASLF